MDTNGQGATSRCSKLHDLPSVFADWQQGAWCPACDYYDSGLCSNPERRDSNASCPFDGKILPLREVAVEASNQQPAKPLDSALCEIPVNRPRSRALEQAIKDRIVNRTGGRMQALAIELGGGKLIVRGSTPCYYVKQLALQGVLDVSLRSVKPNSNAVSK